MQQSGTETKYAAASNGAMSRRAMRLPDLAFSNWMMFDRVMRDPEVCSAFLEVVLNLDVERLEYVEAERSLMPGLGSKPIRMDVFARGGKHVYDVEMQARYEPDLCRRMRYYQSAMDATESEPGDSYRLLPESYIVFLCMHDPF